MKRIRRQKMRYADADFDRGYLKWGFHDVETQQKEAESVLVIAHAERPLHILDIACGRGVHAAFWAERGHEVLGVDLSETFIAEAQESYGYIGSVEFRVQDLRTFEANRAYDLITWIERSFFDEETCRAIFASLKPGGLFMTDVRNPASPKAQAADRDTRTWGEKDGVFFLERHETNPTTGVHEDCWITIDPDKGQVIEEYEHTTCGKGAPEDITCVLKTAGFEAVQLCTMAGDVFASGDEPYWLWMVAKKSGDQ